MLPLGINPAFAIMAWEAVLEAGCETVPMQAENWGLLP